MTERKKGIISFQGEIGANSHIVCNQNYPDMEVLPCETFREALMAVEEDRADLAMIAIENSLAGRVADIHHLLPSSKLFMIAEYFLPIRFHLMGIKGTKLSEIKKVYSHVVGLPQCKNFILEHNLKTEVAPDTAGSARMVSEWNDKTLGAIAPEIAAEIYGLDIIARDIEDEAHNTTRFVVFSKEKAAFKKNGDDMITSFLFRVRNVPASLYKALGGFATNGVNMTKLESYQVDGGFSATQFYAEVIGHPDDRALQLAFEELAFFTDDIKVFGTYKRNSDRDKFVKH